MESMGQLAAGAFGNSRFTERRNVGSARGRGLYLGVLSNDLKKILPFFVMAGLRPGHPRLSCPGSAKTWMPGIADKFTQSAQDRLLWPGMTNFAKVPTPLAAF
jgi:hypothetical protein